MINTLLLSPLSVLVFYGKLRRAGAKPDGATEKLHGLIHILSPADRKEFGKLTENWEKENGQKVTASPADTMHEASAHEPTAAGAPDSRYIFGMSEYDRQSMERGSSSIRPLHGFVVCPSCGKKTDMNRELCMFCSNLLDETVAEANRLDTKGQNTFSRDAKLYFAVNGASELLEVPLENTLTLGRHTPDSNQADVDLTEFGADVRGVSRVHASLKRQWNKVTLTDMHSTNHTFVNGTRLGEDEIYTLTSGDEVALGELAFTVIFMREPEPQEPPAGT